MSILPYYILGGVSLISLNKDVVKNTLSAITNLPPISIEYLCGLGRVKFFGRSGYIHVVDQLDNSFDSSSIILDNEITYHTVVHNTTVANVFIEKLKDKPCPNKIDYLYDEFGKECQINADKVLNEIVSLLMEWSNSLDNPLDVNVANSRLHVGGTINSVTARYVLPLSLHGLNLPNTPNSLELVVNKLIREISEIFLVDNQVITDSTELWNKTIEMVQSSVTDVDGSFSEVFWINDNLLLGNDDYFGHIYNSDEFSLTLARVNGELCVIKTIPYNKPIIILKNRDTV